MNIDFEKCGGLVPVIVQHAMHGTVLMLGYMNQAALEQTRASGKVTFFSRSKQRLWTKGETSGRFLAVREIRTDCDRDALLIRAIPCGPTCHTGTLSCFGDDSPLPLEFLNELEEIIRDRAEHPKEGSYTCKLLRRGVPAVAQKVGEEAAEVIVAALAQDQPALKEEAADLIFHLLVLLQAKGLSLADVSGALRSRHKG